MHELDPTTTVLTAALALMTAFALASETPFTRLPGRGGAPLPAAESPVAVPADGWVSLHPGGISPLPPPLVARGR